MVQHYDTSISLQGWFKIVTELLEDPIRYLMNNKTIAVEGHAQKTKTITEGFASQHGWQDTCHTQMLHVGNIYLHFSLNVAMFHFM